MIFDFPDSEVQRKLWEEIAEDNKFSKKMEKALKEILYIGDGAFKVTIDTEVSEYPILEWYPGERVEFVRHRGPDPRSDLQDTVPGAWPELRAQ